MRKAVAKDINCEEAQTMLLVAGKAFYWDKLVEKIGLGVCCDLINGDATVMEQNRNEYSGEGQS